MMRSAQWRRGVRPGALLISCLLTLLWGCTSAPERDTPPAQVPEQKPEPPYASGIDISLPASQFSNEFYRAEQALAGFDWMAASVALQPLEDNMLSATDLAYLQYLQARIAYTRGQQDLALRQLETLEAPGVNAALQYRARNFRRHALELSGRHAESARLGDLILRTAPSDKQPSLRRAIWRDLQRLDDRQLEQAIAATSDLQWFGWLELASVARNSPPGGGRDLEAWRTNNPDHPAAADMPGGLGYLQAAVASTPQKTAVILPLSGRLAPAGKAVLDGYLAAYYAARGDNGRPTDLIIMDLARYDSTTTAYEEAVSEGVGLIIGPLSKASVADLGTQLERPVPVLALNRAEQILPASGSALVQFSLAPEDEAARIAEVAFGRGARSALVIRPAGEWGDKVERALRQRWTKLGGQVAASSVYGGRDDYSAAVKAGLAVNDSDKRARDVRDMLATNIEFTARRRKDIDAVFLLSRNGPEARSLKPLLAFHYAGSVPVYAISSIYSGIPDTRDKDLDGINFIETPWLLGANPGLRVAIAAGGTGSDSYSRLNALGADAHLLQQRFPQLQAGPDLFLRGNTGFISMDPRLRLHRELSLATFDGGEVQAQ